MKEREETEEEEEEEEEAEALRAGDIDGPEWNVSNLVHKFRRV